MKEEEQRKRQMLKVDLASPGKEIKSKGIANLHKIQA